MNESMSAVVVMGVAGCGKSSVAAGLAAEIDGFLIEGDAFHPEANVTKMRAGIPLGDDDRAGWLDQLAAELVRAVAANQRPVWLAQHSNASIASACGGPSPDSALSSSACRAMSPPNG